MTQNELISSIKRIGIKAGDKLIVHSSFKSLKFEGTPEEVCKAFMEVITEEGLLMMVTHTYCFKFKPNAERLYDRTKTKVEVGAVPDAFFRVPGVQRSFHPTHSVAAWGKNAWEYLKDHHLGESMGKTSPLYKCIEDGGRILMLGCNLGSCTAIHVAESIAEVPYLDVHYDTSWGRDADYIGEDGKAKTYHFNTVPGCSHYFESAAPLLRAEGVLKNVSLGAETSYIIEGKKMFSILKGVLKKEPYYFLREDNKLCYHCQEAFRRKREHIIKKIK